MNQRSHSLIWSNWKVVSVAFAVEGSFHSLIAVIPRHLQTGENHVHRPTDQVMNRIHPTASGGNERDSKRKQEE